MIDFLRTSRWLGACFLMVSSGLLVGCGGRAGDALVFTSDRTGNGDLYVIRTGSFATLLVGSSATESNARLGPGGDKLVYQRSTGDRADIVTLSGNRGDIRILEDPNRDDGVAWSSKWQGAYSAETEGQEDLWLVTDDTSRRLLDDSEPDRDPSWSADGDYLVFAREGDEGWDLYELDTTWSRATPVRLTFDARPVRDPSYSADGTRVVFAFEGENDWAIGVLDLTSGLVRTIVDRPGDDLSPSWSSSGLRVAFSGIAEGENREVFEVDVATLRVTRLTNSEGFDGQPVFVPGNVLPRRAWTGPR